VNNIKNKIIRRTLLQYLLLTCFSIVLSTVAYIIIYAPVRLLHIFTGKALGAYFFMAVIFVFVVIMNVLFVLVNKASIGHLSIRMLFLKMAKIFIPIIYVAFFLITWLNSSGTFNLLTFIIELFSQPETRYMLGTLLLGMLTYYFTFSVLIVKLYFLVDKVFD